MWYHGVITLSFYWTSFCLYLHYFLHKVYIKTSWTQYSQVNSLEVLFAVLFSFLFPLLFIFSLLFPPQSLTWHDPFAHVTLSTSFSLLPHPSSHAHMLAHTQLGMVWVILLGWIPIQDTVILIGSHANTQTHCFFLKTKMFLPNTWTVQILVLKVSISCSFLIHWFFLPILKTLFNMCSLPLYLNFISNPFPKLHISAVSMSSEPYQGGKLTCDWNSVLWSSGWRTSASPPSWASSGCPWHTVPWKFHSETVAIIVIPITRVYCIFSIPEIKTNL